MGQFIKIEKEDIEGDYKFKVSKPTLPICPVCGYALEPRDEACVNYNDHSTK